MSRPLATATAITAMLLAAVPPATAAAPGPVRARFCTPDRGSVPLPRRIPDRDCPDACHALCARGTRAECDEDGAD